MQGQQNKKKVKINNSVQLAAIPDKLYFTIGEVAYLCQVKTHVLRYWEQEFEQLNPVKRKGNRRYYQRKDVILIRQIKTLLYGQGFTIEGAKAQILRIDIEPKLETETGEESKLLQAIQALEDLLVTLENCNYSR